MYPVVFAWWLTAALGLAAFVAPPTTAALPRDEAGAVELPHEPRRVHFEPPVYPEAERAAEIEADVGVRVGVDASGEVFRADTGGNLPLREAAAAAVRKWRYEPSPHVRRWFSVTVRFRLPHKAIHKMPTDAVVAQWYGEHAGRAEALRELDDRGAAILPVLMRELWHADIERRCSAAYLAGRLGEAAKSASGVLVDLVRDASALEKQVGWCGQVGDALENVDPATFVAELDRAVRLRNGALCQQLLRSVHYKRDVPPPVFDALEVDGCGETAARTLGSLEDASALPRLLRAAGHASPVVRSSAIQAIARSVETLTGEDKRRRIAEAMPALVSGLGDPDKDVRLYSAMAFETFKGDARDGVPALARALDDPSRAVRWRVVRALTAIGSQARSAGPALLKGLESPLPPAEDPKRGPTDKHIQEAFREAIAATGAGKDDTRLATEDEIRAAVVAYLIARVRATPGREKRAFSIVVFREDSPPGLVAALGRRGLTPSPPSPDGLHIAFGEVVWRAGDLAALEVTTRSGPVDDSSGSSYNVALQGGVWTVVAEHPRWMS
jgi:TonB family protein